ncbi:MAG: GNAT family N-acetyltransferase [Burkholderiaceae bacterium]
MQMKIELRQATGADAQLVYDITEAAMRGYVEKAFGPWVESFQREVIGNSFDPSTHHVIVVDGDAAGIIAAPLHDSHIQLEKLYLLPRFQRKGVGSKLLRELQQSATARNRPVRLRVLAVNNEARRLYERLDFIVTHETPERVFMEYRAQR